MNLGKPAPIHPNSTDPFYRYDAKRYWKKWRFPALIAGGIAWCFSGIFLVPVVFGAYFLLCHLCRAPVLAEVFLASKASSIIVGTVMGLLILRLPLTFMALLGGATAFWADKAEGRLEQFIVTPIEPWRFGLAHLYARIDGLKTLWWGSACLLGFASLCFVLGQLSRSGEELSKAIIWGIVVAAMHVDLALMMRVDAYVGLRFSASCRTRIGTLSVALPISVLLLPLFMLVLPAAVGSGASRLLVTKTGADDALVLAEMCRVGFFLLARLACGAVALVLAKRSARRQVEALFEPEL